MHTSTRLSLVAFGSGAAVMIFEITASRAIAPYLGNSLITWTSLIGVVLLSLSIGNWLGGKLADSGRPQPNLSTLLLLGASLLVLTNLSKSLLLTPLSMWEVDLRVRTVIAALVLLTPVSITLGTVGPFIGKQLLKDVEHGGRTIGLVSALGNVGSIIGTFLAGFVLLPLMGTSTVLNAVAVVLAVLGALSWGKLSSKTLVSILLIAATIPASLWWRAELAESGFIDTDTAYSRAWIRTQLIDGRPVQLFQLDNQSSSARFLDSPELVFDYNRALRTTDLFTPSPKRGLLIGGAGYTFTPDFFARHPEAVLDVVEIDPGVTELARRHFGLVDDPRLSIFHEDGRTFLNTNSTRYDVIYIDAYNNQFSVPFQLVTTEAVAKLKASLADDGTLAANIIGARSGVKGELIAHIASTFAAHFEYVEIIPTQADNKTDIQNLVLLARSEPLIETSLPRSGEEAYFLAARYTPDKNRPVFTDELAPVERLLDYHVD